MNSGSPKYRLFRSELDVDLEDGFTSQVFDSGGEDTSWDRIRLFCQGEWRAASNIYISNDEEELSRSRPALTSVYNDILLYTGNTKGRYLKFSMSGKGVLTGFALGYPKRTFVGYLPEIYRGNEILERFIAVFQNAFLDRESAVDEFHRQLNPALCGEGRLEFIASMLGTEHFLFAPLERRRLLLRHSLLLQRMKGTPGAIKLLAYLVTGRIPLLIEEAGGDTARLLLDGDTSTADCELLAKLAVCYVPYSVKLNIRRLTSGACLDSDSYMGYCRCAEESPVTLGYSRLGDCLCL